MMVAVASATSLTVAVTAILMQMARAAAMTIWLAEPASLTEYHHGHFGASYWLSPLLMEAGCILGMRKDALC